MASRKTSRQTSKRSVSKPNIQKNLLNLIILFFITVALFLFAYAASHQKQDNRSNAAEPQTTFGQALSLNGTSYLNVTSSDNLNPQLGFTIEAWIKPNNPIFQSTLINRENGSQNSFGLRVSSDLPYPYQEYIVQYNFSVVNSGNNCAYHNVFNQFTYPATDADKITSWQHIAGVVDSSGNMQIYVNGQKSTMNSNRISGVCSRTLPVTIGAREFLNGGADGQFIGNIDEVRISNIARYQDNFQPVLIPFASDQADIILYHFDGSLENASNSNYYAQANGLIAYVASDIVPLPTPTPSPIVLPNIRSNKTCTEVCAQSGYSCAGIGTDSNADNGLYLILTKNSTCNTSRGNCLSKMTKSSPQKTCSGNPTQWTNCHCNP